MVNELFLQTVLANKILTVSNFKGTQNEAIELLHIGTINTDSGPDFFNAKAKINDVVLAGNIEVHVKTSDWLSHHHDKDKAYDRIILHFVYEHDKEIDQNINNNVPVVELKNYIPDHIISNYKSLIVSKNKIPCRNSISKVNSFVWTSWLNRLMISKLEEKTNNISDLFNYLSENYEETLYVMLMRNFGFKINNDAFELLAKKLPYSILKKYADNIIQIEALLFGVSGLLDDLFEDKYLKTLQNEYVFLKHKHNLVELPKEIWKFSKTRPSNFPSIRIAQLAALIHKNNSLFHVIENKPGLSELKKYFDVEVSEYWNHHYTFDDSPVFKKKSIGNTAFELIIINSVVPFLFFMSKHNEEFQDYAFDLLNQIRAEENFKTKEFYKLGIKVDTSFESQALIYLFDKFCSKKACLYCSVGNDLLKSK
jgi:hypothetical protein